MRELVVPADLGQIDSIRDFLRQTLSGSRLGEEDLFKVELSVIEICVNVTRYAYPRGGGDILLKVWRDETEIRVEVRDRGVPFDPRRAPEPDLEERLRTGRKGGLGIFLYRRLMDGFEYRREEGQNVLTLVMRLPGGTD